MNLNYQLSELPTVAKLVLDNSSSRILLLYGAMGSGKTTLIKELANQLGVKDVTSSPTFSLVNEYHTQEGELLFHFDFYRIEKEEEAYDMCIEEYFDRNAWCFVEWPEHVENLLPLESVVIQLTINPDNSRNIQIK